MSKKKIQSRKKTQSKKNNISQIKEGIDVKNTAIITQAVIDVLLSLGVIDGEGKTEHANYVSKSKKKEPTQKEKGLFGSEYKPHTASRFGMSDPGAAFDDVLAEASQLPIFQVEGARKRFSGTNSPGVSQGPIDQEKLRTAFSGSMGGTPTGFGRGHTSFMGLQMDPMIGNNFSMLNFSLSRSNPYMVNRMYGSGMYGDIPVYFLMMQEQNGGILYWPVSIREKYQWYRYFYRTDPHVGSAIDLHTDLPVSRIGFTMPKLKNDPDGSKARKCLNRCQKWSESIGLFDRLMESIFEWNLIGNCFTFCEWDENKKWWKRMTILPPEEIGIVRFPFCDFAFAEYRPEPLIRLVTAVDGGVHTDSSQAVTPIEKAIYDNIPKDVVSSIQQFGSILMDTDPMTGSFIAHLARKRSAYADLGVSTLERVIIPLLQKEHFKYTQLSLSSRLMTPRNKISAPGISPDATDNLRTEIDLSMGDPDYHVVTNFDFSWEQIGAENRLIQLQPEYERIESEIYAALGVTKELITGESGYGGAKLTAEILNTRYLLVRDIFKNFVERKLLYPMAVQNEWYEEDEDGERDYYYPKLTFNRLTIRDNQEMFDALFQMYQKGSLPVKIIYELFNLSPDEMNDLLVDDMFTARDATFNEMLRQVHTDMGTKLVEETDVADRIIRYCGLTKTSEKGVVKTTPVPDIGGNIFIPPPEEKESVTEGEAPEEGEATEDTGTEEGGLEEEGGLGAALGELGGEEESVPEEDLGSEEIIEE